MCAIKIRMTSDAEKSSKQAITTDNPLGNFYSTEEVAKILKLSRRTIQRMIRSGEIAAIGKQRNYRIPEAELKAWIKKELERNRSPQTE